YMMQSVLNGVEPLLPPVLQTPIDYITDGTITDLQNQPALRYYKYCFKAPLVIRDGVAYYKTDVGGELHLSQSEPYPDPTQPVGPNNRIYHDLRWQDDTGIWHFPIKSYTLVQNQSDLNFYGGTLDNGNLNLGIVNFPDGLNNTAPTNLTTNPEGYEYIELGSVTGNDISTNINDYSHATNPDLIEQVQNAYTASHFDPGDDVIGAGDNLCIYSWRERSCYVFTEIDMGELTQECLNDNNIPAMSFGNMLDVPFGLSSTTLENIIYAVNSSVNASGDRCGAIRIKNASSLPWRISVSSPNPIYVWGNYNSSNKRPAGLYCDAINHLSVNWNDNNSTVTGNGPAAAQTTMNAALLYGVNETIAPQFWPNYNDGNAAIQTAMAYRKSATTPVPAQDENSVNMTPAQLVILESGGTIPVVGGNISVTNFYGYNLSNYINFQDHFWYQDGGFENFMRYSENWSGIQEFLMGSFICLWEPQQGVGFKHNQRYSPPTRRWSFDTDFLIMGNLPPGTPFTVHFEKTVWGRKID
ncbi:MAG: hypothetical protein JW928_01450, partial [Candidatus Aureabacteria bacterium]|nr:hypothetical protein [Candidatus Auribacterota bacterium]